MSTLNVTVWDGMSAVAVAEDCEIETSCGAADLPMRRVRRWPSTPRWLQGRMRRGESEHWA
jgi:hypothetical protein